MKVICPHCKETVEMPNEAYSETVSCPLCGKKFQPSKEIAKTFPSLDELLKTPAFVESLKDDIAKANQNVSHADFVAGVQSGVMGINCMLGNPFMMADNAEKEYALQSLVENPEIFEEAIAQNKIMIFRKGERDGKR